MTDSEFSSLSLQDQSTALRAIRSIFGNRPYFRADEARPLCDYCDPSLRVHLSAAMQEFLEDLFLAWWHMQAIPMQPLPGPGAARLLFYPTRNYD